VPTPNCTVSNGGLAAQEAKKAVQVFALRSDIHEEAFVKAGGKTSTGLPKHPFGITRPGGAP
jgi:hypothetical protein